MLYHTSIEHDLMLGSSLAISFSRTLAYILFIYNMRITYIKLTIHEDFQKLL